MKYFSSILIVDDEPMIRKILKNVASAIGFETIHEANDGIDAFKEYQIHTPDLVLMDINMPVMSGLEALEKIRKFNPAANVIMLTAVIKREYIIKAAQAGALHYIRKDLNPTEIGQRLQQIIKKNKGVIGAPKAPEPVKPAAKAEAEDKAEEKKDEEGAAKETNEDKPQEPLKSSEKEAVEENVQGNEPVAEKSE